MEGGYLGRLDKDAARKVMKSAWVIWCMNVLRTSDSNPKYNKIEQGKRYRAIMKGESAAYHAFMKSRGKQSSHKPYKPRSERYGPNFKGIMPSKETFAKRALIKAKTRKSAHKRVANPALRNKVNWTSNRAKTIKNAQRKGRRELNSQALQAESQQAEVQLPEKRSRKIKRTVGVY
jgi:hypothetical protein